MCLCVVCHTVNTFCCLWCLESVTAWQFVVNYLLWLHVVQHCLWFMAAGVFKAMQIFSCLDQDCLFSVSFKILCTLKSRFCPFVQVMSILFQNYDNGICDPNGCIYNSSLLYSSPHPYYSSSSSSGTSSVSSSYSPSYHDEHFEISSGC